MVDVQLDVVLNVCGTMVDVQLDVLVSVSIDVYVCVIYVSVGAMYVDVIKLYGLI